MNTLKFLAVGSSLDSGRDVVGRYRVREESLLPKFDPDAESRAAPATPPVKSASWWRRILNVFRSRATPLVAGPAAIAVAKDPGELTNGPAVRESAREPRDESVVAPADTCDRPLADGEREQTKAPVQREFRFENVTVVCNDLHDADFEFVSRPRGRRSPAKAMAQRMEVHA